MFINDCSVLAEILECPDNYEDVKINTRNSNEVMEIQLKTPFDIIVRTIFNSWFRFKDESYNMKTDNKVIVKSFYMNNTCLIIPNQWINYDPVSYDTVMTYFIDKLKNDPMKLIYKLLLQGARF